jgi:quinoprotein glucose dehydrogenase
MKMKPRTRLAVGLGVLALAAPGAALQAQTPTRSVKDGVYSAAQAARGKAIYAARCSACHGAGLEGADVAPTLAGPRFLDNWQGQSVGDLAGRIRTTMPLDDPGSLGPAQSVDVIAYLLEANRFPAGAAELPGASQDLGQIRMETKDPV